MPWQVLAAINEIETDYGRNLSVSSAGAVGWMQFLPSTWKQWGVDANGDGVADPYNPVDAIFTAARYLHAAGASKNLSQAIFAYNHAELVRAVGAAARQADRRDPVAAGRRADRPGAGPLPGRRARQVRRRRGRRGSPSSAGQGSNAAIPIDSNRRARAPSIFAKQGSPVIAVNDGKIVKVGHNAQLGHYIELQDATGNVYTYAQLGSVPSTYPVPKPVKMTARDIAQELVGAAGKRADAGGQRRRPS